MADDPLHHGNTVSLLSSKYGLVTGRIIYRSLNMVRILSNDVSDRAIEFPMTADGTGFAPELGVSDIFIDSVQSSDYYVDTLGVQKGELLEFFTADGIEAAATGIVAEIIKTETQDAIRLEDGRVLSFQGEGPELPIVVIRVSTVKTGEIQAEVAVPEEKPITFDVLSMLRGILPTASVEVIPSAERTFPDSIQREDMFQDLLADIPAKQQTNPRRIRLLEREVDLALALKNRSSLKDSVRTIQDALKQTVVSAAIPIVKGAKVLNLDEVPEGAQYKPTDVAPRSLAKTESDSEILANKYLDGEGDFFGYLYDLFSRDASTLVGKEGSGWTEDQDVIRTAGLGTSVQGLSTGLSEKAMVTPSFLLSNVSDRAMRVLTSDVSVHLKSGVRSLVAPSDPTEVEGYVILPIKATLTLRPPKNPGDLPTALLYSSYDDRPTIAETLSDLYSTTADPLHAWTTMDNSIDLADWLQQILPFSIHPADSLGPRTPRMLSIMDALGVGHTDLSPPVRDVVNNWVSKSQRTWRTLLKDRRTTIQTAIDAEKDVVFDLMSPDSLLFVPAAEKRAAALQNLMDEFSKRNPLIKGSWSMITASLLNSNSDSLPLLYSYIQKTDGLNETVDEVSASLALSASRAYAIKVLKSKNVLQDLKSAPEISKCPHVQRLEKIRNVSDVLKRSRLLHDFIDKYQGPRVGSWMTCVLCKGGCVCYHEILELEALAQPSRLESIQKQMLVSFGGERYEGKIVCKNCGQALQDIDYDEHVEFNDDGKAITGRSVLTDEQMAEVTDGTKIDTPASLTFASTAQQEIASALQVIVDRAGIRMTDAVIRRIVRYVDIYVGARAPPPAAYEAQRAKALAASTTKVKLATGSDIGTIAVPTYAAVLDQLRVTALASLVTLALQTADPPIEVPTPFPHCKFSRGGWPLEPDAPKDTGAVLYISCVIAHIQRDMTPWSNLAWSGITKLESRQTAVLKAVISGLSIIVQGDPKTGPLTFTPEIRTDLIKAQTDVERQTKQALVSQRDILTHGFRPEVKPPTVARPVIEKEPGGVRVDIRDALQKLAFSTITEMHTIASVSVSSTDAVCCPKQLQDVPVPALSALGNAYKKIGKGTHLWQRSVEESVEVVEKKVEESIYFKLFLQYCYLGAHAGQSHEFSFGNICRQCGFEAEKDVAGQAGPLKIEVTEIAFENLSTLVRRNKRLIPLEAAKGQIGWKEGLDKIASLTLYPDFSTALKTVLASELPSHISEKEEDIQARAIGWGPIAILHDELKAQIVDRVGPLTPRQSGSVGEARAREAVTAFDTLDRILEDPFVEGPRNILEYWCTKVSAAGRGFGVTTVAGAKWFKISQKHNDVLNALLLANSSWYAGDIPDAMRPILVTMSTKLAPFIRTWISSVRPGEWTKEEARLVLRTIVFNVWCDAISTTSAFYEDIVVAAEREKVAVAMSNWTRALMIHIKAQVFKYDKETIRRILQERAELERTSVVKEFEDIKDDDQRAAELMKKGFRIGRWGVGKNLQKYDANLFEFESEQRLRMGIADAPVDPILLEGAGPQPQTNEFGFAEVAEEGYDCVQDTSED